MRKFSPDFEANISTLDKELNVSENFDIIKREMLINSQRVVMYLKTFM